jgi:hypothetical protein
MRAHKHTQIHMRRYVHGGNAASASVAYRSTRRRNLPMLPITSISPGWCSGSTLPRTTCFGALPIENCDVNFAHDAAAGDVVKWWQIGFRLLSPLEVGQHVDITLPGFTKSAVADASLASITQGTRTIFAFEVMAKALNPGFPVTVPHASPEYVKIGCYEDVRTQRAVGGGTCGNFKDADGAVTSVDACARIAGDKGYRGFCIADGSTCLTSRDFFLEYDTYNETVDIGELEIQAEKEFVAEVKRELEACLNETHKLILEAKATKTPTNLTNASCFSAMENRTFEFNTTGMTGCLRKGMGGPGTMNCYELIRKPKVASKIAPKIRCGQCAEWDDELQTLRFIAEEYVEAGVDLVLGFNSSALPLQVPIYGLARDDKSISTFHSNDGRAVYVRSKERAICKVPPIKPMELSNSACVPPTATSTVEVCECSLPFRI